MAEMKLPHEWSDEELWGYAMLHSQTEVAAFRHDMLALLVKSAGEDELAAELAAQPDCWRHLSWSAFAPLYAKYKEKKRALAVDEVLE